MSQKVLILTAVLVLTIAAFFAVFTAIARSAEPVHFRCSRAAVAYVLDTKPYDAVADIEAVCTQEQVDQLQARWFPAPTDAERKESLESADRVLEQRGIPENDAARVAIQDQIQAIPVQEPLPEEIGK